MTYQEQLKHPNWQRKRLEVMCMHDFKCQSCGSGDKELHVHHPYYTKGMRAWDYPTHHLMCLCEQCHESEHAKRKPQVYPVPGHIVWGMQGKDYMSDVANLTYHQMKDRLSAFYELMVKTIPPSEDEPYDYEEVDNGAY